MSESLLSASNPSELSAEEIEQASLWLSKFETDPFDAACLAALQQWLADDDRHRWAYAEVSAVHYAAAQGEPEAPLALRAGHSNRPRLSPVKSSLLRGASVFAMALTMLFAWTWLPLQWQNLSADTWTEVGAFGQLTLADGSELMLDSDSAVRFRRSARGRELELLRGRIHVKVQPDPEHPFMVSAGDFSAQAIGTAFSVDALKQQVVVDHGLVRVAHEGGKVARLQAGAEARWHQGSWQLASMNSQESGQKPAQKPAWTRRQLVLSSASTSEVLAELDRYLPGRIWYRPGSRQETPQDVFLDLREPSQALADYANAQGLSILRWPGLTIVMP